MIFEKRQFVAAVVTIIIFLVSFLRVKGQIPLSLSILCLVSFLGIMLSLNKKYTLRAASLSDLLFYLLLGFGFLAPTLIARNYVDLVAILATGIVWIFLRTSVRGVSGWEGVKKTIVLVGCIGSTTLWMKFFGGESIRQACIWWGSGNQLGLLMFVAGFIAYVNLDRNGSKLHGVLMVFFLVSLIVTTARASWLGLFLSFTFYHFTGKVGTSSKFPIFPVALGALIICSVLFTGLFLKNDLWGAGGFREIVERVEHVAGKGISGRDIIWLQAVEAIKDSSFLGYGWSYSENLSDRVAKAGFRAPDGLSPHNTFLHTLMRGGIVGFCLYLLFLAVIFLIASKSIKSNNFRKSSALIEIRSLMVGVIAVSMFESFTVGGVTLRNVLFTLVFVGALAVIYEKSHPTCSPAKRCHNHLNL